MIIRKLRLQRGWSQEQLAEISGLSVRTVQRIERGQNAGLESLKSLAAVFEIDLVDLQLEAAMPTENSTFSQDEAHALEYVRDIKGFYAHLISYVITIPILILVNYAYVSEYIWVWCCPGMGARSRLSWALGLRSV